MPTNNSGSPATQNSRQRVLTRLYEQRRAGRDLADAEGRISAGEPTRRDLQMANYLRGTAGDSLIPDAAASMAVDPDERLRIIRQALAGGRVGGQVRPPAGQAAGRLVGPPGATLGGRIRG